MKWWQDPDSSRSLASDKLHRRLVELGDERTARSEGNGLPECLTLAYGMAERPLEHFNPTSGPVGGLTTTLLEACVYDQPSLSWRMAWDGSGWSFHTTPPPPQFYLMGLIAG